MVTWVAYCPICKEELDQAPNGALMEAVAKAHADGTGHRVILGFFVDPLPGVRVDTNRVLQTAEYDPV